MEGQTFLVSVYVKYGMTSLNLEINLPPVYAFLVGRESTGAYGKRGVG